LDDRFEQPLEAKDADQISSLFFDYVRALLNRFGDSNTDTKKITVASSTIAGPVGTSHTYDNKTPPIEEAVPIATA